MSNETPNSVMKDQKFEDLMKRYHGQMENGLYAAEMACPSSEELKKKHFSTPHPELSCTLLDVPYKCPMRDYNALCTIPRLRRILRDHVEQYDIEIPTDNTQSERKAKR